MVNAGRVNLETMDKSLLLKLEFFGQILHFQEFSSILILQKTFLHFFKSALCIILPFWKVLDEVTAINLFHNYFKLIQITFMFLNSAYFKVCLENQSHIFINEHLRRNVLAMNCY